MHDDIALTERDVELRRMLVAAPIGAPARTRRRGALVALIGACTLIGAGVGGVVSATAITSAGRIVEVPPGPDMSYMVPGGSQLFGSPVVLGHATSGTDIEFGEVPAGATQIFVALRCVDAGSFGIVVDGESQGGLQCDESGGRTSGGLPIAADGPHSLSIEAAGSGKRFDLWASWWTPQVLPEPSAEQASAMADGAVTEDEYRAGFARYKACVTDAGYPVDVIDETSTIIYYINTGEAVDSGAEPECYAAEFALLDSEWQIANQ